MTTMTERDHAEEVETVNAVIDAADIRFDRDFILSAWVTLNYGGSGQGFGGYVLGGIGDAACAKHAEQPNLAAEFICGVMEAAGVNEWSQLKGRTVRVRRGKGFGGLVIGIGHIIKDDHWFEPKARFDAMLAESLKRRTSGATQ